MTAPTGQAAGEGRTALDWKGRLVIVAGTLLFRVLGLTWRVRVTGPNHLAARRQSRGGRADQGVGQCIVVVWHGEMVPTIHAHAAERLAVMVSQSRDGEIIAGVIAGLGSQPIRGSSSAGGLRALMGLVKFVRDGGEAVFTPDGPRGPRHSFAPGAALAAAKAKVPLVLIRSRASRAWQFRSWDRFELPKPFATLHLAYSEPITVQVGPDGLPLADEPARLAALMTELGRAVGRDD